MTLVTLIIRSMGRPSLQAALASAAAQDYPDLEVAVVAASGAAHPPLDDRCGRFALRLVGTGQRLPRAAAANCGLDAARGDYCVFLDDDDHHDPEHVSGLMRALAANPASRVAYSAIRVIGDDDRALGVIRSPYDRLALHHRNYIQIGAALFERSLVAAGCRFDEAAGAYDDWDFWIQCSQHTDFAYLDRPTTNWRSDSGGSGAGGGANFDPEVNAQSYAAVRGKWTAVRDELSAQFAALVARGEAAEQRSEFQEAERAYRAALRLHAAEPDTLNRMARLLYARQATQDALGCLRLALRAHPERADIACNLVRVEMERGNPAAGRVLLDNVLRRDPDHPQANALRQRYATH